jgi:Flp pilus assembly pilin Flp
MIDGIGVRGIVEGCELVRRFGREDDGQDIIEYALITALFGIVGMLVLRGIQISVGATYDLWLNPSTGVPSLWSPPEP